MNLRNKVFISIFLISIVTISIIFYVADKYFYNNYITIEKKEIIDSVKTSKGLLDKYEEMLNNAVGDWSAWDDTYNFVQDLNEDFINNNMQRENFISLSSNYMIFLNEEGKVIYSKGYDLYKDNEITIPSGLIKFIESDKELNTHSEIRDKKSGFVCIEDNIFAISSMPIINSKFEGPIKGTLILARIICKNEIASINSFLSDKVNLELFNDGTNNQLKLLDFYSERNEDIYIEKINNNNLLIRSIIYDISGNPSIVLSINYPRDIYNISQEGKSLFYATTAVIVLFSILCMIFLLEKYVFKTLLQQESLLNTIPAMVYYKDRNFRYIMANNIFCKNMKVNSAFIKGKNDKEINNTIFIDDSKKIDIEIKKTLKPVLDIEGSYIDEYGKTRWFTISKAPVLGPKGNFDGVVGVIFDTTNLKEITKKLDIVSYYDNITMLPNREFFMRNVLEFIKNYEETKSGFSIFYISIDNFELINEVKGHQAGDELLRVVSERITENIKAKSFVSRISGEEFAIIFNETDKQIIDNSCNEILNSMRKLWNYENESYYITISIGIAVFPTDGVNYEEIVKSSYIAMNLAKANGKNTFLYYSKKFSEDFMEKLNLENNLRLAIKRNEFILYYQPQYDTKNKNLVGMEALIRWKHPEKGLISPGIFIPVAEESGLIVQIGEWVIKESCRQIRAWMDKGINNIQVSVNVSAKQFQQDNLEEIIKNAIEDTKIPYSSLEIEITESLFINNSESIREKLFRIKNMGINILLDDFGTGYSSLLYLKLFPIDKLKIDQNFVRDMLCNEDHSTIIKTIVTLSKQLGIKTIAEGVEEKEQYGKLKELDCDEIQGYLFGKPMSPEDMEVVINEDRRINRD